jgi:hypothetical protein
MTEFSILKRQLNCLLQDRRELGKVTSKNVSLCSLINHQLILTYDQLVKAQVIPYWEIEMENNPEIVINI